MYGQNKVPLLFGIPIKPPWDGILICLCMVPMLHKLQSPNFCTDPTMMLPGSARGTGLCRRDLGFFHVVSQSGQTNPAERSYKLGIVKSCWEALTVYKGEKLINPWVSFFVFISLWGQLWKGNDCKQPISKTALVKIPQRKVISNCYVSQGFPPRSKRQKRWN